MSHSAPTDSELDDLTNRVLHGDRDALALMFEHYRGRLRKIVSFRLDTRVASRVDVEDVLQEAYMNADQRLQHLWREANTGGLFVWLRLIVQQTIADVHRRHLAAQSRDASRDRPLERPATGVSSATSMASWLLGHMTSPSQAALRKEVSAQLEGALSTLSELDREILMLRHVEELSNVEAAAMLGLSEQGASARYVRALGRLQQILTRIPGLAESRNVR